MPTPRKDESKEDFVSRCVSYINKNEKHKYKDNDQIVAVCYSMWDDHNNKKKKEGS